MVWLRRAVLAGLLIYVMLISLGSLWWPMGRDQGIFASVGSVIVDGGLPYRDAWEVKGPATHYTFAAAEWLFGNNLWGIRLLDLVLVTLTALALWRLVRQWADPLAAHLAAGLLPWFHYREGYWGTAQPDGWATMLVVIALAVIATGHRTTVTRVVLAGALVGVAASFKLLFAGFLAPLAVVVFVLPPDQWTRRLGRLALLGVGSAAAFTLVLLPILLHGAWSDFWDIQFEFNRIVHAHARHRSALQHVSAVVRFLAQRAFFDSLIVVACGLGVLRLRKKRTAAWVLAVFLLVALACVVLQGKYYWYHWWPALIPLMIATAMGLASLRDLLTQRAQGLEIALLLVLGWMLWVDGPGINASGWKACVLESIPKEAYYRQFARPQQGGYPLPAIARTADYLRRQTDPHDTVQVWGFETLINVLSSRRPPTRFGFNYPMIVAPETEFSRRYRQEFLDGLKKRPPAYIVVATADRNDLMPQTSKDYLQEFPEFQEYLDQAYFLEKTIEGFELWRRKGS